MNHATQSKRCWTAVDWYGSTGLDWCALCRDANIDPEIALGDGYATAVEAVIAHERQTADEIVVGVEDYVWQAVADYREKVAAGGPWP